MSSKPDTRDDIPDPTSVTYTDYEDPFAFVDQSSGAPQLRKLSNYAWVGCGGDIYVLECLGKGFIRIEPIESKEGQIMAITYCSFSYFINGYHFAGNHWQALFTPPTLPMATAMTLKISPFQRSRKILTANNLADAIKGSDTYARTKAVPGAMALGQVYSLLLEPSAEGFVWFNRLLRTAKWRQGPATDSQKSWVRKRLGKRDTTLQSLQEATNESIAKPDDKFAKMTKGEAANIITRLKHGAQVSAYSNALYDFK